VVFFKSAALVLFQCGIGNQILTDYKFFALLVLWKSSSLVHLLRFKVFDQKRSKEKLKGWQESSQDHDECSSGKLWLRPERKQD